MQMGEKRSRGLSGIFMPWTERRHRYRHKFLELLLPVDLLVFLKALGSRLYALTAL